MRLHPEADDLGARVNGCIFCDIVAGDSPAKVVGGGTHHIAFEPLNPFLPGHLLFVPRTHVSGPMESAVLTGTITTEAVRWAQQHIEYTQFNVIMSEGQAATQTVFHLHVHLLPRRSDDDFTRGWPWYPSPMMGLNDLT